MNVATQLDQIFARKCIELASDSDLMVRFRACAYYKKQIELGRTECQAICSAVANDM
mgnify:CR=1 FL=1